LDKYAKALLDLIFDPNWKPLYWKLYWQYCPLETFKNTYHRTNAPYWKFGKKPTEFCVEGNFYYHFMDDLFYYRFAGKTRTMVHRIPKRFAMMANRKLYEKTPSEAKK